MPSFPNPVFLLAEQAGGVPPAGGLLFQVLPFLLMFGVIYFLILRPMSTQEKERKKRVDAMKKGDHVVLGGGIMGRISNWDDPTIAVIEIADKVKVRVLKKDIVDARDHVLKEAEKDGSKDSGKDGTGDDKSKGESKSA